METTASGLFPQPKIQIIEAITASSPNPVLRKKKFFKYLEEYRNNKLCIKRPKVMTPEKQLYYDKLMGNQVKKYIQKLKKKGFVPY